MSSIKDNPVVESVNSVINSSTYVKTDIDQIKRVASWMAYEEFPAKNSGQKSYKKFEAEEHIKSTMLMSCINFAFTNFDTQVKYEVEHNVLLSLTALNPTHQYFKTPKLLIA